MRQSAFALLLMAAFVVGGVDADDVVLLSDEREDLRPLAERLRPTLPAGLGLILQGVGESLTSRCVLTRLIIVRGEVAARAALQACPQGRIWVLGVSGLVLEALRAENGGRISGIAADPPLERQVAILDALRPRPRQVAVPYSAAAAALARQAAHLLSARGFQPLLLPSDPQVQPLRPLREVLAEVQAVLVLPDPSLYHESLIKHWLLMTTRERVPMIGGLGGQDVRRGIAAAAVQVEEAALELTFQLMPQLLGSTPLPGIKTVEASRVQTNPLILERLGLTLELE